MIYQNLGENEIAKIASILNQYQVIYQVSVHEEAIERASQLSGQDQDMFRKKARRSGQTFMQIEIDLSEFQKIPAQAKDRLHALGIYEEVESPFSEEELNNYTSPEYHQQQVKKIDPNAKLNQAAAIAVFAVVIGLIVWKRFFQN